MRKIALGALLACALVSGMMGAEAEGGKSKSGFLLGVELGAGSGAGRSFLGSDTLMNFTPFMMRSELEPLLANARVLMGFQKYFGKRQLVGFDMKVKAGTGFLNLKHDGEIFPVPPNNNPFRDPEADFRTSYFTLNAGGEMNLLWDFYNQKDQAAGMSFGVGYEYVQAQNTFMGFEHPLAQIAFNSHLAQYTDKNFSYQLISPKLGFHYYVGNHQFAGVFSFDKVLGKIKNVNPIKATGVNKPDVLNTDLNFLFSFNLSYVYRF